MLALDGPSPSIRRPVHIKNAKDQILKLLLNSAELNNMKTIIQTHKEGKWYVAVDLITNVADQGTSEEEAISNLKKGLEEHYEVFMENE